MLVERMVRKPLRAFDAAQVRDDRTRKIDGPRLRIEHHLRRIGVFQRGQAVRFGKGFHERGDVRRGIVEAALHGFELRRPDERLVALHVDDHVVGLSLPEVGFPAAIRAALMVCRGHLGLAAERHYGIVNPLVVRGDHGIVQYARHLLVDPPDNGFPAQHGQRFGREAGRRIPRRYDCDKFHRQRN